MSYIGTEPKDIRSFGRTKFDYTATQGQTAFTGADDDGKVLAFTVGQIEVYVNGILMDDSDFTTTGTGTVTLASAANLNDVVNVVSFETNIPDSNYVPASGGTFTGNVTFSGTTSGIDMNGTELVLDADGDTSITADTDDHIDFKTAGTDRLKITTDKVQFNVDAKVDSDNARDLGSGGARWKDLYLSGGAYIGGTAAANYFDDYEEGDWTAAFASQYGSITTNSSYQTGTYTKIGRTVHINIHIRASAISSPSGNLTITGLPFSTPNNTDLRTSLAPAIHFSMTGMGGDELVLAYISNNSNVISLASQNGNNIYSAIAARVIAGSELYIGGHYSI